MIYIYIYAYVYMYVDFMYGIYIYICMNIFTQCMFYVCDTVNEWEHGNHNMDIYQIMWFRIMVT